MQQRGIQGKPLQCVVGTFQALCMAQQGFPLVRENLKKTDHGSQRLLVDKGLELHWEDLCVRHRRCHPGQQPIQRLQRFCRHRPQVHEAFA